MNAYFFSTAIEALSLSQKINFIPGKGTALVNLGNAFSDEGEHEEAVKHYEQALKIKQQHQVKKGIAECYNNIGIELWNQSQFSESLKNHNLALSIREEIKDTIGMAFSYQNTGNVFIEMGLYPDAVEKLFTVITQLRTMVWSVVLHSGRFVIMLSIFSTKPSSIMNHIICYFKPSIW